jgi:hypothetical protein
LLNLRGILYGRGKRLSFMDNEVLPSVLPAYRTADIKYVTRLLAVTELPSDSGGGHARRNLRRAIWNLGPADMTSAIHPIDAKLAATIYKGVALVQP